MEKNEGKLVELKTYNDRWLIKWCRKELADCATINGISGCQTCQDYGKCVSDPIRVILKRLRQKEPVLVEEKESRFMPVS